MMKYLTNIHLFLFVMCNNVYSQHSAFNNNKQQQQLSQEEILQQQIQLLQQQLQILQQQKNDFEYLPTVQGYKFSYKLPDGSRREENAFITGLHMDAYSLMDSRTTDFTAVGVGGRPKINRKLSPGSLKALSG